MTQVIIAIAAIAKDYWSVSSCISRIMHGSDSKTKLLAVLTKATDDIVLMKAGRNLNWLSDEVRHLVGMVGYASY